MSLARLSPRRSPAAKEASRSDVKSTPRIRAMRRSKRRRRRVVLRPDNMSVAVVKVEAGMQVPACCAVSAVMRGPRARSRYWLLSLLPVRKAEGAMEAICWSGPSHKPLRRTQKDKRRRLRVDLSNVLREGGFALMRGHDSHHIAGKHQ